MCSFNVSLSATSLTHKDEIGLGLSLSGACSSSTLLMAPVINLCQSLFCSLQVTPSPFVKSLLTSVSLFFLSLCASIWSSSSSWLTPLPFHCFLHFYIFILTFSVCTQTCSSTWVSAQINIHYRLFVFTHSSSSLLFVSVRDEAEVQFQFFVLFL